MEHATHVIGPHGNVHSHTVILLHGRDSIAREFAEEFFESQASDGRTLIEMFPTIKWVFPISKIRNSARFEADMSQWFDMWSVENPSEKEEIQICGLRDSIEEILNIMRIESSIISANKIILGGISQGCAAAILALLCGRIRLGGFIGFCSWLPLQSQIASLGSKSASKNSALEGVRALFNEADNASGAFPDLSDVSEISALTTPVFLSHSQDDDIVPIANGRNLVQTLQNIGVTVFWKEYLDGGHWVNEPQGVDDIVDFLHKVVLVAL